MSKPAIFNIQTTGYVEKREKNRERGKERTGMDSRDVMSTAPTQATPKNDSSTQAVHSPTR
jgi:hypothetical protein